MPTMLDFSITQMYRLVANDLLMIFDALVFYRKYKKSSRTVKEFLEVLANMVDVESENFEEIKARSKLSSGDNVELPVIVWDFLHEIVIKHFIDDMSQYPFWMAKVAVTTGPQAFGITAVYSWLDVLRNTYATKGVLGLYEGAIPYLVASVIVNYKYVLRTTNQFIITVLSKIPHSPSQELKNSTGEAPGVSTAPALPSAPTFHHQQQLVQEQKDQKLLRQSNASGKSKRTRSRPAAKENTTLTMVSNAVASVLSHPFLVISLTMIKSPGGNWISTYFSMLTKHGVSSLYRGVRTRTLLSMVPLSPLFLCGITDTIMYRRMLGQGTNTDGGGLVSVLRQIVSREGGGTLSLLNYGLLTLVQLVPGFVSFLTLRSLSWVVFGRSLARVNQYNRRKEIVESHLNTMTKKSINSNNLHNTSGGNISPTTGTMSTPTPALMPSHKTTHFNL